jgi:hypothetical protein
VQEVEAIVQSLYNTTREKIEEHAKSISNMEKWRLVIEEKISLKPHRGCVHNKMKHTQLLYSFQKGKDLKLEIEMACNHCTKVMV